MKMWLYTETLPNSIYVYTREPFFYFNALYTVREVDHTCYTDHILTVADAFGGRLQIAATPMSLTRLCAEVCDQITQDDWVDVYLLNGRRERNIQRSNHDAQETGN